MGEILKDGAMWTIIFVGLFLLLCGCVGGA